MCLVSDEFFASEKQWKNIRPDSQQATTISIQKEENSKSRSRLYVICFFINKFLSQLLKKKVFCKRGFNHRPKKGLKMST